MSGRLIDPDTGAVVADELHVADSFAGRLVGLLGKPGLKAGQALLLRNCRSVHSWGMRFSIDVVFLADDGTVAEIHRGVRPWRLVIPVAAGIRDAVEFDATHPPAVRVGQILRVDAVA